MNLCPDLTRLQTVSEEDITKRFATKDFVQFMILMKLKMKFTFSANAKNISHLEINFSLKYRVISIIFRSHLTQTW